MTEIKDVKQNSATDESQRTQTKSEAERIDVFNYYGDAFIELGKALKNENTTITELSILASKCGLRLRVGFDQDEAN